MESTPFDERTVASITKDNQQQLQQTNYQQQEQRIQQRNQLQQQQQHQSQQLSGQQQEQNSNTIGRERHNNNNSNNNNIPTQVFDNNGRNGNQQRTQISNHNQRISTVTMPLLSRANRGRALQQQPQQQQQQPPPTIQTGTDTMANSGVSTGVTSYSSSSSAGHSTSIHTSVVTQQEYPTTQSQQQQSQNPVVPQNNQHQQLLPNPTSSNPQQQSQYVSQQGNNNQQKQSVPQQMTRQGVDANPGSSASITSSSAGTYTANTNATNYHIQQIQKQKNQWNPSGSVSTHPLSTNSISAGSSMHQHQLIAVESPLPTSIQRTLGDRSNEKRKNAALEIESLIKHEANNFPLVVSVINVLSKDFCTSMNANYRKGGLVGLAATSIGLLSNTPSYLNILLPPVLHCFDDPESRVRYYACESLYNIAKVSRQYILQYFTIIFEGLTKLFADVDVDVKNGANLLDRLIKDIVTEAGDDGTFHVEQFLPLLQSYIRRTNPYIRQLIVGWITLLDSIPDISMLDYLPDFLDGLFNMLSDTNREIRQAADSALSDFLRELAVSTVLEFGPIISILVYQCKSKERLNRLTAITWIAELTHHPRSGGDSLLPYHASILGAIMFCLSDSEKEIRIVAESTNNDLLQLVHDTSYVFKLRSLLDTITNELLNKDDVPTKMAALRWINMLMEKRKDDMNIYTNDLLPVLLTTLSDPSDAVVLLDLQVLSRISLSYKRNGSSKEIDDDNEPFDHQKEEKEEGVDDKPLSGEENTESDSSGTVTNTNEEVKEELQFQQVLTAILNLFAQDRHLLEARGSLIIRKLCVLLNAKSVYIRMADTLSSWNEISNTNTNRAGTINGNQTTSPDYASLEFISTMVQTLNLILLTASELHDLRSSLARSFDHGKTSGITSKAHRINNHRVMIGNRGDDNVVDPNDHSEHISSDGTVFATLYHCWCHNPVATFSLCLLARAYDLSFELVQKFSSMDDVTVGFLMQIDKLVHLLESPVFVHLRLQLLNVEAAYHAPLLKSIYGLLMCLPQGDAYRLLNDRLATVCNLRDNLEVSTSNLGVGGNNNNNSHRTTTDRDEPEPIVKRKGLDMKKLLERFDYVLEQHIEAKYQAQENRNAKETINFNITVSLSEQNETYETRNGTFHALNPSQSVSNDIPITTTPTNDIGNSTSNTMNNRHNNYALGGNPTNSSMGGNGLNHHQQQLQSQQQQHHGSIFPGVGGTGNRVNSFRQTQSNELSPRTGTIIPIKREV